MNPLVSVVVPVYNVEKYLDRCVTSITNQTYSTLEIILVDDGSTDSSSQVCDQWQEKDFRIRVVHQENRGLPGARETGVQIASGTYVMFVDSDDWIADRLVELAVERAIADNTDVVYFDFNRVSDISDISVHAAKDNFPDKKIASGSESLEMLLDGSLGWNIWRLFIKKKIFNYSDFTFPVGIMMGEDLGIFFQVLGHAEKVSFLPFSLYYYYNRSDSSVNMINEKTRDKTMRDLMFVYNSLEAYIKEDYPNLERKCKALIITQLFSSLTEMLKKHETGPMVEKWKKNLRNNILSHADKPLSLSKKNMIRLFVVWTKILWINPVANFFYKRIEQSR